MTISELKQALENAPDDSSVTIRTATGETCYPSAVHIGAGGDVAGTVSIDCAPQAAAAAESEDTDDDVVDTLARKAGVLPKKAPKKPAMAEEMTDEAE